MMAMLAFHEVGDRGYWVHSPSLPHGRVSSTWNKTDGMAAVRGGLRALSEALPSSSHAQGG